MHETIEDIESLQDILDKSRVVGGRHLGSIFSDDVQMSSVDLIAELDSVFEMHVGCLTTDGSPLVAPVDGILFKGKIWFGFPGPAVRAKLIRQDPRISASYQRGKSFAFIVHGQAVEVEETGSLFAEYFDCLKGLYTGLYGPRWIDWYHKQEKTGGYNGFIEPRRMFAKR